MLTIEVNDRLVLDTLNDLTSRLQDMRPVMAGIGQEMVTRIANRFETETDPNGTGWKPWAESTRKNYPSDGNGRILDRYGDMLDSLNFKADADSVQVGFGVGYAAYHEFGTKTMRPRGMIFDDPNSGTLSPDDTTSIIDLIRGYLVPD